MSAQGQPRVTARSLGYTRHYDVYIASFPRGKRSMIVKPPARSRFREPTMVLLTSGRGNLVAPLRMSITEEEIFVEVARSARKASVVIVA